MLYDPLDPTIQEDPNTAYEAFTARRVAGMAETIQVVPDQLPDPLVDSPDCDCVQDFAGRYGHGDRRLFSASRGQTETSSGPGRAPRSNLTLFKTSPALTSPDPM